MHRFTKTSKGYYAVPPPYTGNFVPPKSDLVLANEDEYVFSELVTSIPDVATSEAKTSESKPKSVGEPLIEDWISDSEVENESESKSKQIKSSFSKVKFAKSNEHGKKTPKESVKKGNPQLELQEKGVIDSGCSRNMTGNKSYLSDYEEIDGGFVAFEGDPKGGKITGKGKISTGKLDFKDLLDENHVLLRVPRKDNMYSVDLKNIVPSGGITCLFAKATLDESNLWHRRLGHINFKTMNKLVRGNLVRGLPSKIFENNHTCVACQKGKQHKASCKTKTVSSISQLLQMLHMDLFGPTFVKSLMKKMYCLVVTNDYSRFSWVFFLATKDETSEILKTFITGIENLIDLKVKVIRCDNRTEFKNKVMNQFCEIKGIKREFSVARTPQQNEVAKRKKRTLIEAARTMLADSKLPTTFWAKAVNTACYVQNRVLVIKPHNKTPYELFLGRNPALSFMRPFGCPVTILNTLDHLVVAGNQTNGNACTKENIDAGQARKKTVSSQEYILNHYDLMINPTLLKVQRILLMMDSNHQGRRKRRILKKTIKGGGKDRFYGCDDDPIMPNLEEIAYSIDDEDVGTEADMNNLNTFIPVSPIPTIRLHKDHPLEQIIGDIHSSPQTRRMTKSVTEHVEPKKKVWTLVDLPYGKREIGTKWVYRNKKDNRGFEDPEFPNKVYKVEKALYGLHQAPRAWYETLSTYLLENGFRRGTIDKTLFIKKDKDDAQEILDEFYGGAHFLLRVAASTPMETNKALLKDEEAADVDVHLYRSMIGSLMYLTASRPDIMFALCACARFQIHHLTTLSDSDYAGASLDRKSTTGGCQFLGRRLITWQCKKHTIVANSITEAEYVAPANCYGQVLWIQNQLLDYGYNFMNTKIFIDNESTVCIVKNPVFHSKTKHIETRHHFIRDSYEKRLIQVIKIHTDHNVADLLTKAFDVSRFQYLIASIGMLNL
ncbi:putative ribonuclease H-like domain-containing protein [Tanacetum coccineum]